MFIGENKFINEDNLQCIPRIVNKEQNDKVIFNPTTVELKKVVISMNMQSAAGLQYINRYFFQKCWKIINQDLIEVVKAFSLASRSINTFPINVLNFLVRLVTLIKLKYSGLLT